MPRVEVPDDACEGKYGRGGTMWCFKRRVGCNVWAVRIDGVWLIKDSILTFEGVGDALRAGGEAECRLLRNSAREKRGARGVEKIRMDVSARGSARAGAHGGRRESKGFPHRNRVKNTRHKHRRS